MIWQNLKKMKKNFPFRIGRTNPVLNTRLEAFRKLGEMIQNGWENRTRTDNPKGKVGELQYIFTWNRRFEDGNKKWFFRKFEKKPFDNAVGFIEGLKKHGFEVLGSGAFSTVLAKPGKDRVVKVIRRPDGWVNYVKWAAEAGEAGRFAPKVFSYKKIKGRQSNFAVAVMERLSYTLEKVPDEADLKILPDLLGRVDRNPFAHKMVDMIAPGLGDFAIKMGKEWNIPVSHFDFHSGNMMVRENGQFVIVDPVSRGEDKYNRLRAGDFPAVALLIITLRTLVESSYRHRSQRTREPRSYLAYRL